MRQAAGAAHVSLGGLYYYYFPSKRNLVLHGFDPEASQLLCLDFLDKHRDLETNDPGAYLQVHLQFMAYKMTAFIRPALLAALELGAGTVMDGIEASIEQGLDAFIQPLRAAFPHLDSEEVRHLGRAMRRMFISAMLDRSITASDLHDELAAITGINRAERLAVQGRIARFDLPSEA